jgi:hypothetical protein
VLYYLLSKNYGTIAGGVNWMRKFARTRQPLAAGRVVDGRVSSRPTHVVIAPSLPVMTIFMAGGERGRTLDYQTLGHPAKLFLSVPQASQSGSERFRRYTDGIRMAQVATVYEPATARPDLGWYRLRSTRPGDRADGLAAAQTQRADVDSPPDSPKTALKYLLSGYYLVQGSGRRTTRG